MAERPFGFLVATGPSDDGEDDDHWTIHIPGKCRRFGVNKGYYLDDGQWMPHPEAIAELERFLAEGQAALGALRERREFGYEETG